MIFFRSGNATSPTQMSPHDKAALSRTFIETFSDFINRKSSATTLSRSSSGSPPLWVNGPLRPISPMARHAALASKGWWWLRKPTISCKASVKAGQKPWLPRTWSFARRTFRPKLYPMVTTKPCWNSTVFSFNPFWNWSLFQRTFQYLIFSFRLKLFCYYEKINSPADQLLPCWSCPTPGWPRRTRTSLPRSHGYLRGCCLETLSTKTNVRNSF